MNNIYRVKRNATIMQYAHVFAASAEEAKTEAQDDPQGFIWLESSINDPILIEAQEVIPK